MLSFERVCMCVNVVSDLFFKVCKPLYKYFATLQCLHCLYINTNAIHCTCYSCLHALRHTHMYYVFHLC